jgi:hypothetical protein
MPMLPFAPVRFSTTTGCPQASCSRWPTIRESKSAAPPCANGTMIRSGLDG